MSQLTRRAAAVSVLSFVGLCALPAHAADIPVSLSGTAEVPPVQTQASGEGTITVNDDHSVTGAVTTQGIEATMAHIHQAPAGENGPVVIPLEKKGGNQWAVPAGARFDDAQYKAYQAGHMYVNVHSAAHKGGEIRGQLEPR